MYQSYTGHVILINEIQSQKAHLPILQHQILIFHILFEYVLNYDVLPEHQIHIHLAHDKWVPSYLKKPSIFHY